MADAVDYATETVAHQQAEALARHQADAERARRIEESMRPRNDAEAHVCVDCGDHIDPKRVQLLPMTRRCTECAATAERYYREDAWKPR